MSVEDTFFDDLVCDIQRVKATRPAGVFDRGWNAAVRTCICRIYHFFGRGNPPGEILQTEEQTVDDPVNHPSHYTSGNIEVIDFIEDQKLGYHLGSAMKYICRAGKKDPEKMEEDLRKAIWYLERYISKVA